MNYGNIVIYHILITARNTETKLLNLSQDKQEKRQFTFSNPNGLLKNSLEAFTWKMVIKYLGNVIFVAVPVTAKQGSLPCVPEKQERVTIRHFGPGADKPAVTVHVKTAKVLFM